jgi:hypothetical protein
VENSIINQRISENFKRRLVACVNKALQDDLSLYLSEFHPDTKNGVPHLIGDWINTNIRTDLAGEHIDVMEFSRFSWRGKVIIDRENSVTYTIMREKRLFQIRKHKRDHPHYLQTIVAVLNANFEAPVKQMNIFGVSEIGFEQEVLDKDYNSIFCGCLDRSAGFTHCVIVYDTFRNELSGIKILFLDRDLDEIERIPLNEFIKPDFSTLTDTVLVEEETNEAESKTSEDLIALKSRPDTDATPAQIREKSKEA